ncbi:putative membrane protein, partial [Acinetobacter baumannii 17534]
MPRDFILGACCCALSCCSCLIFICCSALSQIHEN